MSWLRGDLFPEKGGALRNQNNQKRRAVASVLLSGGLLLVPLVLLQSARPAFRSVEPASLRSVETVTVKATGPFNLDVPSFDLSRFRQRLVVATTTTTTAPPPTTTAPPPTTTTTAPPPPTTTTTAPPPPPPPTTTTTGPTAGSGNSATGIATWYSEAPDGYCASPWLPFGTVLLVTDVATGASVTCTVDDREADNPGRVVDMSPEGFSQLAPLSAGVLEVTITW